jgi:hypothetical protein
MNNKAQELREVVGKTVSCNFSPTLRAKLVKINKKDCILQVEPTLYRMTSDLMKDVGKTFRMPIEHTWNAYFY